MRHETFERKYRVSARIPSVSMGNIAFLLLIFFMATTIFAPERGIEIRLPRAEAVEKHENDKVLHVWIDQDGHVSINDRPVASDHLHEWVMREVCDAAGLVIAFNADERVPYRAVAVVLEELKDASGDRASFTSEPVTGPPSRR
jgi:biopolymer transport protein ExbD